MSGGGEGGGGDLGSVSGGTLGFGETNQEFYGGGYTRPTYQPPPTQQEQIFNWAFPMLQAGMGQEPYGLPSAQGLQPTQQWYQGISPDVRAGIQAPYNDVYSQMMQTMRGPGSTGPESTRVFSGPAEEAAAQSFSERAGQNIGMHAWGMTAPGLREQYRAEVGRNVAAYNRPFQEAQLAAGLIGGTYPTKIVFPEESDSSAQWADAIGNIIGTLITTSG